MESFNSLKAYVEFVYQMNKTFRTLWSHLANVVDPVGIFIKTAFEHGLTKNWRLNNVKSMIFTVGKNSNVKFVKSFI
jgi:hypothetical protein